MCLSHTGVLAMGLRGAKELIWIAGVATCLKLLLMQHAYRSTDFEVHRHWLTLTHSLPPQQWYLDQRSEWTLDYPPFFAWFEKALAFLASKVDPRIVDIENGTNYDSPTCVAFQRLSVMATDLVLYFGLWRYCRDMSPTKRRLVFFSVVLSPGLFIVDHIHFQYNGFLLGLLLLSLAELRDGRDVVGGILFATLVCFKHLFAVAGPVYFVYLLRHYCTGAQKVRKFVNLALSVSFIVALAFGPFFMYGQIAQVISRLFPFGRGLCHAYWAPNIWALYNTTDKVMSIIFRKLGMNINMQHAGKTGGLVGDLTPFAVLPQVTPAATMVLVLLAMFPCLYRIWRCPSREKVVHWVTYAYMCGFLFGWHVHEKASLQFVIPFSLFAADSIHNASNYLLLSTVSYYSLFPLLYNAQEYPIKVLLLFLHFALLCIGFVNYFESKFLDAAQKKETNDNCDHVERSTSDKTRTPRLFGRCGNAYMISLIIIEIYGQFLHPLIFRQRLPFLPLMLTSVFCSFGILYVFLVQPW